MVCQLLLQGQPCTPCTAPALLPGKLSPGTEGAAAPTAFPKGQKSWTPALTHYHLQTQFYGLLCLQLLDQGLAHYFDYSGILSFVKTFVRKGKLNISAIFKPSQRTEAG